MNRYDGQPWWRTAAQFTVEVIIAVAFIYIWFALALLVFFTVAWLASLL